MEIDYERIIDNISDGLYIVDTDRKIVHWNKAAERITGYTSAEVVNSHCWDNILVHVDGDGNRLCHGMCPLAATIRDGGIRDAEIYLHHKDGHRVPVWSRATPLRDAGGTIVGGAELFTDLSHRNAITLKIQELEALSLLDSLTQLANRRYAEMELKGRLAEMERLGLSFGVLLIDIDHFKRFNDTYGHGVGDLALKTVARTLASTARPFDFFGRWGGEEFVGIIRHVDRVRLETVGKRVRALVESTKVKTGPSLLNVTVSIGAALAVPSDSVESLLKRADDLLYASKRRGRNCLTLDQGADG